MTEVKRVPRPRLRRLSEDEIELWLGVTASVKRRAGTTLPERLAKPEPAITSTPAPVATPPPRQRVAQPVVPPLAPMERKLKQKLARGRMSADAAIDLHGFRQAEAFSALRYFLVGAQRDGARIVLVVTGKGGRRTEAFDMTGSEVGVLRRSVPLWLGLPEFRPLVIGFEEAARSHGGSGALYVRLRRRDPVV